MHKPVLLKEVLYYLNPQANENFIDCTIGEGGHGLAVLERIRPNGILLGIDWDEEQIKKLESGVKHKELKKRLILVHDNFSNLEKIIAKYKFGPAHGVILDLGFSSWHIEKSGRGFTFLKNERPDMRYRADSNQELTAEKIVNEYSEEDLAKILREYGEEIFAARIAETIVYHRRVNPIKSTEELANIVKRAVPGWYRSRKIHPATKTFQALRIAVNNELRNIETVLPQAFSALAVGGSMAVITFHSLEDRLVKNFFRQKVKDGAGELPVKKPIGAGEPELKLNPRARSAKLRIIVKIK